MPPGRHNEEGEGAVHVGKQVANLVDVLAAKFDLIDLEDLVTFMKKATGLGCSSPNDPTDNDCLSLVLHRGSQRFVRLLNAHDL